jgi:hypothetical protein
MFDEYDEGEVWLFDQVEEYLKEQRKIIRQRQIKHDRIEALVNIITNQRTLIEELAEANEMYRKMVKDD